MNQYGNIEFERLEFVRSHVRFRDQKMVYTLQAIYVNL